MAMLIHNTVKVKTIFDIPIQISHIKIGAILRECWSLFILFILAILYFHR